jgi:hypothetical protein
MFLLLAAPLTFAATPAEPLPTTFRLAEGDPDAAAAATAGTKKRSYLMEVGFRGRYMSVPGGLLNSFVEAHEEDEYPKRPEISAYALGLEFVVKEKSANGIFYVEYMNPMIEAGYWDDADRDPGQEDDGSWVEPQNFALITIGANYAYELRATNWLSFLFGAGLGAGIVLGDLYEWEAGEDPTNPEGNNDNQEPDCGPLEPAYLRYESCAHDNEMVKDGDVPPVIPFIDINIGFRFNISDKASIRLEGGLHDMFYGGGAVSVVF